MIIICPHCHTPTPLDACVEDGAARELHALLPSAGVAAGPLIVYLGLFKPRKQALRWTRAVQLAREVLDLEADRARLAAALNATAESLRDKRQAPGWKPLTNHRYLLAVLDGIGDAVTPAPAAQGADKPKSKAAQAADALSRIEPPEGVPIWLARAVLDGLSLLWTSSLDGTPALDLVEITAQRWIEYFAPKREWNRHSRYTGEARVLSAFSDMAQRGRWPQPADVLGMIPRN